MTEAAVVEARNAFTELTKPGTHSDHEANAAAAQAVTLARFAHFAAEGKVFPEVYPPPPAGDGSDVFDMADEGGEGTVTFKEFSKFIGRNQNLKNRLREGWEWFTAQFSIENLEDCPKARFMEIWAEAAAKRADA
eukprot:TRINITY_DN725_c0_g1_i1.p1 TRINITY_DN725_c0_g1~~TRINITY_DN725_c0_g1_i1.p1  ORF type:complete len:153 (+),score=68.18 TRINITY_DN725_c0_g1_i1:56-460(+)